ncbi:Valine--tRNA ligase, partial [Frankliniella fusca]
PTPSCDQEDKYFNDLGHPFSAKELSDLRTLFDDPEDIPDSRLKADLIIWSLQHKIGRNALTGLLHILRQHNHPNLPLSSKTLLKTPRSTVTMLKSLGAGLFWYYNILVNLVPRLTENFLKNLNGNLIEIEVFVDEDFISEANKLMSGFTHLGYNLKLVIRKLIADAPARTWLKNVNQHGSYNACERCTAVGQWIASRMTYHPYEETELRTAQSLRDQIGSRYHKGPTPLTELSNFSLIGVSVYGQMFNVYNVHHLKHLADECRRHGDLESFSAFKYENHLGVLKRLLHAPGRTLSQIVCRLMEQVANQQVNEEPVQHTAKVSSPCELPASLSNLGKGFSSIYIPKCKAELTRHSFFLSVNKEIVKLSNIVKTDESYILPGRKFQWKANYFTSPCPSSALDIYEVDDLGVKQLFSVTDVLRKCVVIPIPLDNFRPSSYSEGPCLALPMIHGGD